MGWGWGGERGEATLNPGSVVIGTPPPTATEKMKMKRSRTELPRVANKTDPTPPDLVGDAAQRDAPVNLCQCCNLPATHFLSARGPRHAPHPPALSRLCVTPASGRRQARRLADLFNKHAKFSLEPRRPSSASTLTSRDRKKKRTKSLH